LDAKKEAQCATAQAIRMAGSVLRASRMTVCFFRRAWQALPIAARLKGVAPSLHKMRGKKKRDNSHVSIRIHASFGQSHKFALLTRILYLIFRAHICTSGNEHLRRRFIPSCNGFVEGGAGILKRSAKKQEIIGDSKRAKKAGGKRT